MGVCWDKSCKKWIAQIGIKDKIIKIGRYELELCAARAYNNKAKEFFGEFANLNIIN